MKKLKNMFGFLGVEANARAVGAIATIFTLLGAFIVFILLKVMPILAPGLSTTDFGQGYRSGRRELELEYRVRHLETYIQQTKKIQEIKEVQKKVKTMTTKELLQSLENGTF